MKPDKPLDQRHCADCDGPCKVWYKAELMVRTWDKVIKRFPTATIYHVDGQEKA